MTTRYDTGVVREGRNHLKQTTIMSVTLDQHTNKKFTTYVMLGQGTLTLLELELECTACARGSGALYDVSSACVLRIRSNDALFEGMPKTEMYS
jgi:hypothetical protein